MRLWIIGLGCVACSGEPATCDGGGEPAIEAGMGGADAFVPFGDGDTLEGSSTGLQLDLWTTGLDTTQAVTTVVRISADGGPTQDSIAQLTYNCDEGVGHGWTRVTAALPAEAADGSALDVSISATDAARTNASLELSGTLAR